MPIPRSICADQRAGAYARSPKSSRRANTWCAIAGSRARHTAECRGTLQLTSTPATSAPRVTASTCSSQHRRDMALALKTTPLNAVHRALGARLTDFGGWEMPLHYGSQIEEHHRVRRAAGMFDVSHMLALDCEGRGAPVPAPAARERRGQAHAARQSALLLPAARGRRHPGRPHRVPSRRLVPAGGQRRHCGQGPGVDSAQRDALRLDVQARRDLAMIAVQGPQARASVWQARPTTRVHSDALAVFQGVDAADCSSPAPATPARTDSRSCCPHEAADCGAHCSPPGLRRAAWALATRCAWRPG